MLGDSDDGDSHFIFLFGGGGGGITLLADGVVNRVLVWTT